MKEQGIKKCAADQLAIVLAFKRSGLCKREFCEQQGLKLPTFKGWYYRFAPHPALKSLESISKKPGSLPHNGFTPFVIAKSSDDDSCRREFDSRETTYEPLRPQLIPFSSLCLRFLDYEIVISQNFDERTLQRLLSSLQAFSRFDHHPRA